MPVASHAPVTPRWQTGAIAAVGGSVSVVAVAESRLVAFAAAILITFGVIALWSRGKKSGGWAVLGLATLGLTVGIGIGLRRLTVGAVDLSSVVATLALGSSLIAVGFGISRITSGLRLAGRIVVDSSLVVLVAVTVWTITPALIATQVPPISPGEATPADFGFEAIEVQYDSEDGVRLSGWYAAPTAGRVAIVRHGAGSTASDALPQAEVLVSNGFGVLITDARGHGKSGGEAMDFGWFGDRDVEAAVDFLMTRPEVDPEGIVLVGLSMGGEEAIGAAGSDTRISAVVTEGATARTEADKAWLIAEYGWRGWVQTRLEWVQYTVTDLLTPASKPPSLASAAAEMAPRELLLITGAEAPDEGNAARHIERSGEGNVRVWTVPGAGHIQGLKVAPKDWERRVIEFLNDALSD